MAFTSDFCVFFSCEKNEVCLWTKIYVHSSWGMKVAVCLISFVVGSKGPCRMGASSRQQCQLLCDTTSYCDAWSYNYSIQTCWMKQRHGWSATADDSFDSGFKNNGPFYQVFLLLSKVLGHFLSKVVRNETTKYSGTVRFKNFRTFQFWKSREFLALAESF